MNISEPTKQGFTAIQKMIKNIIVTFDVQIRELTNQKKEILKRATKELEEREIAKLEKDVTSYGQK